jgi:hypothetical protein
VILTDISVNDVELVSVFVEELLVFWPEVNFLFEWSQNMAMSDFFVFVDVPKATESADEYAHEEQEL